MNRTITYHITQLPFPHKISGFLKEKGYSEQNLTDLRKREQAICLNGTYVHMNQMLTKGDILTVYIQENYNKDLNMAVVSNYISMNYSVFSFEFKNYAGVNFVTYLKELRMKEAKKLLEETDKKIIEISQTVIGAGRSGSEK